MRLYVREVGGTITLTTLHPWSTVKDTKDALQELLKIPGPRQRLVFRGEELRSNNRRLLEWDITDGSTLQLFGSHELENPIRPMYSTEPPGFSALVEQAKQGIAKGLIGKLAIDGTGGTYFLRNAQRQEVLVFKPADEEAFGPNNPRGHVGRMGQQSFRPGVLSGEGHLREVAAYLLDHHGFAGVPPTARMEVACRLLGHSSTMSPFQDSKRASAKTKVGSMQAFVRADDVAANFSERMFPIREVHKIAILDIRLVNTDRNDANVLVINRGSNSKQIFLVPIDHAFCLPDTLEIAWADWAWLNWPQAKQPVDEETKAYVQNLDIEQDIEVLRNQLFIREPCLRLMRITHMLLQRAIARGCTLFQIGSIICRKEIEEPSQLEVMCHQATALSQAIAKQLPRPPPRKVGERDDIPPAAPVPVSASSSTASTLSLPPISSSRSSSPVASFPPPSPSSWANSSPTWPLTPSRYGLNPIDEDDLAVWSSLPLLATRRSNSSPSSPPAKHTALAPPLPAARTASTPRAPRPNIRPKNRPKHLPKPDVPPHLSSVSTTPAILPMPSPLSLLARVSTQKPPVGKSSVLCPCSPISTLPKDSSIQKPEALLPKTKSQQDVSPSTGTVTFSSFPSPSPASPASSFASYPLVSNDPSPSSFSNHSETNAIPITPQLTHETTNPGRHGATCSPAILSSICTSPRNNLPALLTTEQSASSHQESSAPGTSSVVAKPLTAKFTKPHVHVGPFPAESNDNPQSGSLLKSKKGVDRREGNELSNGSEVVIKIIGDDNEINAQKGTRLSTSMSSTFSKKIGEADRFLLETATVVARHIASPDISNLISTDAWAKSDKSKRLVNGTDLLTKANCELARERTKEKDVHEHDSNGPLPLLAKRRSGEKHELADRLSRDSSGSKNKPDLDQEKTTGIETVSEGLFLVSDQSRKLVSSMSKQSEDHDKENSHGSQPKTFQVVAELIDSKLSSEELVANAPLPTASREVVPSSAPKSVLGVGLPLGLDKPLELKRTMSYSFSVTVHPTGFAAGSKSTKSPTRSLKTKSVTIVDNDDWSIPLSSNNSNSNDPNSPTSPTGVPEELFFSCLAKLIDTVLDFTLTRAGC